MKLDPPPSLVDVIGEQLQVVAYLLQLGARRGMIVVRDFAEIAPHVTLLASAGFAFSVIDWAGPDVIVDADDMEELFRDWGWASLEEPEPSWKRL